MLCALENKNKNVICWSKIKTGGKNITVSLSTWEPTSKGKRGGGRGERTGRPKCVPLPPPQKVCVCVRFVDLHSSDMWVRHTPNKRYAQADNRYVYAYSFTREQTATQRTPPKTRGKSKPSKWLSDHIPWQKGQRHISLFRFFFFFSLRNLNLEKLLRALLEQKAEVQTLAQTPTSPQKQQRVESLKQTLKFRYVPLLNRQ